MTHWMKACSLAQLTERGVAAVSHDGRVAAIFAEGDRIFAVDNRCPHMGFPLTKGTLKNGILTCHWHSWQFDATGGGCFTQGGSPVEAFACEVRGTEVWVGFPEPARDDVVARWRTEFNYGMERFSTLRLSKATYTLLESGVPVRDLVARGVTFGTRFRDDFADGLSILTAMANVVRDVPLPPEARVLALVQGLRRVAENIRETPHRRAKGGLPGTRAPYEQLVAWFRGFVHDREEEAAERVLTTVILSGAPPGSVEAMLHAAITEPVFLDEGHVLDFTNKAFELLGHIGWESAPAVLPTLIHELCTGQRHEEDMMWKQPHDLISIGRGAAEAMGKSNREEYDRSRFIATVLGDDPQAIGDALVAAGGIRLAELASAVAEAAALRLARFHTRNEFTDWDWAHHALTTAEALRRMAARTPSPHLRRALADCAMYVFLARFLNIPKHDFEAGARSFEGRSAPELIRTLEEAISLRKTEEVAAPILAYWSAGHDVTALCTAFVRAGIREDLGFHGSQAIEYGVTLARALGKPVPLVAAARYLAAHSPTARFVNQTVENAIKLQRGEALHE